MELENTGTSEIPEPVSVKLDRLQSGVSFVEQRDIAKELLEKAGPSDVPKIIRVLTSGNVKDLRTRDSLVVAITENATSDHVPALLNMLKMGVAEPEQCPFADTILRESNPSHTAEIIRVLKSGKVTNIWAQYSLAMAIQNYSTPTHNSLLESSYPTLQSILHTYALELIRQALQRIGGRSGFSIPKPPNNRQNNRGRNGGLQPNKH
ncbi:MAG: hypothetical protein QXP42_01545 [Candidatus Micrarchaeia archaeon]